MKRTAQSLIAFGFIIMIAGCSDDVPTPQEQFREYLSAWQKQDFAAMYAHLSTKAKKQISKKKFVNRYKEIYQDFDITNLVVKAEFDEPKEEKKIDPDEDGKVQLPFTAKMDTLGGPVKFTEKATIVKEARTNKDEEKTSNWYVNWTTRMIFPELTGPKIEIHGSTLEAYRGEIADRKGRPLAVNVESVEIGIWPGKLQPGSKKKFSKITGVPIDVIEGKLDAGWVTENSFVPITMVAISQTDKLNRLSEIPGIRRGQGQGVQRVYPYGEAAGHLTGYLGKISGEELEKLEDEGYNEHSLIGRAGLEAIYEDKLRAKDGYVIYTTDSENNRLKTIAKRKPKNGETIQVTINAELQKKLYEQLAKNNDAGTAAAIDPKTGEVLALVSAPGYDPDKFHQNYNQLKSNPKNPLRNRFSQAYVPGSSFKPIVASIGLETGAIDPDKERTITGPWQSDKSWGNYRVTRVDHITSVNLQKALVYSDNIYFAQTAVKIGPEQFLKQVKQFGFGQQMPSFPFSIEPAQITENGKFNNQIQLANSGYGQGKVVTSTLQLAIAYTPFVNDGQLLKPVLDLKKAKNQGETWHQNVISSKIANRIVKDLIKVVESPHGTGHQARINGFTIAGKTGTAELKESREVENGKVNGWFIAFDTKNPQIMIAMMIENVQESVRGAIHGS
ncbi:MAG TPA: penicillin-binding transpeptidase domain-containing protein, partial [Bacillales bacterium]